MSKYDVVLMHGQINYLQNKAKCRHLKKLTCEGTLWQVFIKVYRLETLSVMLVLSTQLSELLPLYPLFSGSSLPLSCVKVNYKQTVCG
jgi:hypothetical protein